MQSKVTPMPSDVKQPLPALGGKPWLVPRAAYVHIPFCLHHCHYCDFAVVAGRDEWADRYLDALEAEIRTSLRSTLHTPLATLFIGGGTPTQLTAAQLDRLFTFLRKMLPLTANAEVGIEANPDGLTDYQITVLLDHGVTRISLGVQSFQPDLLQFLERRHTPGEAIAVVGSLVQHCDVSVDLIFGVPGQTFTHWRDDLKQAIGLGVNHLSTYGLTYEKGTRLWKSRERGLVLPLVEDLEADMYGEAIDRLAAGGFEHYEISNFARPGHRCRHNEIYWANHAYLGFGLGAARYVNGIRSVNTRSLETYVEKCTAGKDPTQSREELSPEDRARETAMLNLRRCEGIVRRVFQEQTGFGIDSLSRAAIERNQARGWLADDGARISLTRAGKFVADTVMGDILICVCPTA